MPKNVVPDNGIALWFIRRGQGWSQTRLADAAVMSATLLNQFEQGKRTLPRARLEHLAQIMNQGPEVIDATLERLQANRAAARTPGDSGPFAEQRRGEAAVARLSRLAAEFGRSVIKVLSVEGVARQARDEARKLWARLERWESADQRIAVVEESPEFRTWALSELVAAKSIEAAPSSPAQALELAALARLIAEMCPCEELLRQRTEGYAWFHVANARRVTNDLRGSDAALGTATKLWEAGASGDPGYFDETIGYWIEAAIRRAQRRFTEAQQRIEGALAADRGHLRGKLLLSKAQILWALGDIDTSTEVLHEAIAHVDSEKDPRTALGVRCQFLLNLCLQGRAAEAAPRLPAVQSLAERLGQEMDLIHVGVLSARIAAGCGRVEEAEEGFERARRKFFSQTPRLVLDYAQVSMDLALLLLEQGRAEDAGTLANQMKWIFSSQGIEREALAALRVFCEAAWREVATVCLARRVILFLHQSRHDPGLKFQETEEAELP
jgi:transcriptional regulator with XRE-family HTH domain